MLLCEFRDNVVGEVLGFDELVEFVVNIGDDVGIFWVEVVRR